MQEKDISIGELSLMDEVKILRTHIEKEEKRTRLEKDALKDQLIRVAHALWSGIGADREMRDASGEAAEAVRVIRDLRKEVFKRDERIKELDRQILELVNAIDEIETVRKKKNDKDAKCYFAR